MPKVQEQHRGRNGATHVPGGNGGGNGWSEGWEADHRGPSVPTAKVGMWLFIGVGTLLFSALTSAYIVRMGYGDWQALPKPGMLWVTTAVLVLSSAALQGSWMAARRDAAGAVGLGLLAAAALGAVFIIGQLVVWQDLQRLGYFVTTNPSSSFFYLITALHGAHIVGGIGVLGAVMLRAFRGHYSAQHHLGIELCAMYWHFLLLVWLVMYGLILFT